MSNGYSQEPAVPATYPSQERKKTRMTEKTETMTATAETKVDTGIPLPGTGDTANGDVSQEVQEKPPVLQGLDDVKAGIAALQESFDQKIKADAKKDELFNRLHDELQGYRNGLHEKQSDAIALEVIRLIDSLSEDMDFYAASADSDPSAAAVLGKVEELHQELLDILYRQGIEPYQDDNTELDSHRQTNVQTVITEDSGRHRSIAEHVADGYEKNGRVLRKERVRVYRAVPGNKDEQTGI